MRYFPLSLGPMQESGSSLLRALQNESMIPLDLLVREAVQNSLDAALKPAGREIYVDVMLREHGTDAVADLFASGIDKEMLSRLFPHGGRMLEIRDKGTEGLTGPLRLEDVGREQPRGNLLKLVYEVGRTRSDETFGGSWGLGKTCYFRVGVGLVLYYSRIQQNDHFEERLVACLVENESDENRLQRDSATGIAWWGGEAGTPLTDTARIATLLRSIDVQPYSGEDTGTTIIIPFLRPDLIPQQEEASSEEPDNSAHQEPLPWWTNDYASYVRVALERWFCARIDNYRFRGGPALTVHVNGLHLQAERMQPVFQVLQALYNRLDPTPNRRTDYLSTCGVGEGDMFDEHIDLNGVFGAGRCAGRVTAVRLTPEQLRMLAPENMPDPYRCIFGPQEHAQRDRPLVAFMRGPGMVIRWDNSTEPKGWGGGTLLPAGKAFVLGLFVPEKDRELKEEVRKKLRNQDQTLEAYLRSCERADHHQWVDQAGLTIISRIRSKVGNVIGKFNTPVAARTPGISLRAARNLADRLLPSGFGQDGRVPPTPPDRSGGGGSSGRGNGGTHWFPELEVRNVRYAEDEIHICWRLYWGKGQASRQIALGVDSEAGVIDYIKWIKEGLGPFPSEIKKAAITDVIPLYSSDILEIDRGLLVVRPWKSDMDGATVNGELTICMLGVLAGSVRPVLHVTAAPAVEDLA